MFTSEGRHLKDLPLSSNIEEFQAHYSLFVFNLNTADGCKALSPISKCNFRLEMRFRVPLPHTTPLLFRLLQFYFGDQFQTTNAGELLVRPPA